VRYLGIEVDDALSTSEQVELRRRGLCSFANPGPQALSDAAATDLARAETLVDQVLAASPGDAYAHHVKGHVLIVLKQWEEAIPEYEAR